MFRARFSRRSIYYVSLNDSNEFSALCLLESHDFIGYDPSNALARKGQNHAGADQ
jgi:hypothetical protein